MASGFLAKDGHRCKKNVGKITKKVKKTLQKYKKNFKKS
jgi:hypothetical protein